MCFVVPKFVNMWSGILKTNIQNNRTRRKPADELAYPLKSPSLSLCDLRRNNTARDSQQSVFGAEKSNCLWSEASNHSSVALSFMESTDFWCFRLYVFKGCRMHKVKWGLTYCRTIADQRQSLSAHQKRVETINIGLKFFWMAQTKLSLRLDRSYPYTL